MKCLTIQEIQYVGPGSCAQRKALAMLRAAIQAAGGAIPENASPESSISWM